MLPIARKDELVIQSSGDELLVFDLRSNQAFCLNKTSVLIWKKCDGKKSPWEIQKALRRELKMEVSEDLIWFALERLFEEGLIFEFVPDPDRFDGLSRREVIRKLGVSATIALPIIASLRAPMAAKAQSTCVPNAMGCLPNGNVGCTSPNECCSCNCSLMTGNCVT